MRLFRALAACGVFGVAIVFLVGCNQTLSPKRVQTLAIQGKVHGGQQPVSGSTIQLYATSASGTGGASTALISATVTTSDGTGNASDPNANPGNALNSLPTGYFTITGDYTCPTADSQVYLTASGGNPGLASGTNNTALELIAPLGSCAQLGATTSVNVDEVTTVGAVAALYPYMTSYSAVGSASTATQDLANLFSVASEYISTTTGFAPGPNLPSGFYASSNEINALANSVAYCVNSAGGTAGDGSRCGALFLAAKPSSGTAPTDTVGALIDILNNPTNNVSSIFNFGSSTGPFQPTPAVAPPDWTLPIVPIPVAPNFLPGGGTYANAQTVSITSPTSGVTIYYTTNGATPTTSSSVYSSAVTVAANETLKAIAVSTRNAGTTAASTASYTITGAAATPVLSPVAGTYTAPQLVTIASATADATIYYTVDGTTPTAASAVYTGGVWASSSTTVKAIAIAGSSTSGAASAAYTIQVTSGTIYTFAGTLNHAGDGGPATSAAMNPSSTAVDGSGNLYIVDIDHNAIRKVTVATGIVTTVAGNGSGGYSGDGGPATSAQLSTPRGVAVDASGNLYIADYGNNRIRKVTAATGVITTVAGNGTAGYNGDNIAATAAELKNPFALAVDAVGNLYIADYLNQRIRKVTAANGMITTVAGTGTAGYNGDNIAAASATVKNPTGVAVDGAGNLYIADYLNYRVREVSAATGTITTVAGNGTTTYNGDSIAATTASIYPYGVAVDVYGNLYIPDRTHDRIRKVTAASGVVTTVAGNGTAGFSGDNGLATSAEINLPSAVAVDGSGNLYISDNSNRVREVAASTGNITTVAGAGSLEVLGDGGPATSAYLFSPQGLAVASNGDVYVADTSNNRIRKIAAATGIITTVAGNGTAGYNGDNIAATSAALSAPQGVALDASDNLYIADSTNNRVRMVSATTGVITTVAGNGSAGYNGDNIAATSAELYGPAAMALDASGNLYIADAFNERVRKVAASTGVITTVAGNGTKGYNGDNIAATSAELYQPEGIVLDASGNLYVSDTFNARVRMVAASTGTITTVAGNGTAGYNGDSIAATSAELYEPGALAFDSSGNLYIGDGINHRVRKVASGIITTFAGNGTFGYSGDGGAATAAEVSDPSALAFDAHGRLYLTDQSAVVRVVYP
jgi:sugar lactone lactonase YvrE